MKRVLLIDNYDSFTHNLTHCLLLEKADVSVFRNQDISLDQIAQNQYSHIVISPGPKTPSDAGISKSLISRFSPNIPILGICLGHQCIAEVFGASVIKGERPMHGKVSKITHTGHPLFANIPSPTEVTRYHSLTIDPLSLPACLKPIATSSDSALMALAHTEHPTFGVQFHPESICSPSGQSLIHNFLSL